MEPEDPQHPADGLIDTLVNTFNGNGFKKTLRDAWDRLHGTPQPSAHDVAIQQMNKVANDKSVQDANASHVLSEQQAASIRNKVKGK